MFPITIFAFNRPAEFKRLIDSLKKNPEHLESELYIFIDGPREQKPGEKEKVQKVFDLALSITGFKDTHIQTSESNKGLGPSIIKGVSKVINKHEATIVLEDDLIVQPNFLRFMNDGLERYKNEKGVWSICGYTNKIKASYDYSYDAYFCTRSSSWGWATWKDRWETVDWSFCNWDEWVQLKKQFNRWGGSDCFSMLEGCKNGRNKSWAIRFCFNQFLQDKLSLFPVKSLILNEGFDGNGTNCKKYSRFKFELMDGCLNNFNMPESVEMNTSLFRQALHYHSIPLRIWSKLMYLIKK